MHLAKSKSVDSAIFLERELGSNVLSCLLEELSSG